MVKKNNNSKITSPLYEGHHARKQFGQNFLCDEQVITDIVNSINPQNDDTLIEIGPGLAALTEPVCDRIDHLNVIEIDRDLADRLRHHPFIRDQLTIYEEDALKFDFTKLFRDNKQIRIYGNLPYNISTPLIFHLLSFGAIIKDMHFMLQKEVVERLVASPGTKDYGRLSVMSQYHCKMMPLLEVPPFAFRPAPKVYSGVIRIIPFVQKPYIAKDENLMKKIATSAFNQRRKTISNSLSEWLNNDDYIALNLDPKLRAENLTVKDFVEITNYLSSRE